MDKAKRRTLRIGPLRYQPARVEHSTSAECGKDLAKMLKDAAEG